MRTARGLIWKDAFSKTSSSKCLSISCYKQVLLCNLKCTSSNFSECLTIKIFFCHTLLCMLFFKKEFLVCDFTKCSSVGQATISNSNSTSVCVTAPFKKKRYYLCDWRIPANIFQIEQSALGYCLAALWCVLCGLWGREKKDTGVEGAGKGWDKKEEERNRN